MESYEQLTRSDQSRNMSVACYFAVGYLLDSAIDVVEESFCLVCSWHFVTYALLMRGVKRRGGESGFDTRSRDDEAAQGST